MILAILFAFGFIGETCKSSGATQASDEQLAAMFPPLTPAQKQALPHVEFIDGHYWLVQQQKKISCSETGLINNYWSQVPKQMKPKNHPEWLLDCSKVENDWYDECKRLFNEFVVASSTCYGHKD